MILASDAIVLAIATVINAAIGLYVFASNPKSRQRQVFCVFVLGGVCWSLGFLLLIETRNFFFDKITNYGALLGIFGLVQFAQIFPKERRFPVRAWLLYAPFVIAAVGIAPWNFIIDHIQLLPQGGFIPIPGPLNGVWTGILIAYTLASIWLFRQNYRDSRGKERLQLRYFFLGISIFVLSALFFDAVIPAIVHIPHLVTFGPLASVPFVCLTAYAIVRHQLMDIRVVIQRGAIYSFLLSLLTASYIFLLFLFEHLFDETQWIASPLSAEIIIVLGTATVPQLERYFRKVTDRFFFKDNYSYAPTLERLGSIANSSLRFKRLAHRSVRALDQILRPEWIVFMHAKTGKTYSSIEKLSTSNPPIEAILKIPIISHGKCLGTFLFGPKRSGDPYYSQDLQLLRTFSFQAASAFQKAELYQELQEYSRSLEQRVYERTKELVVLQEQQRQLFHNISHALQTPVTVLKSALELETAVSPTMLYVSQSIDELSTLISDLLRLARLDSMPKEESLETVDFSRVVADVVEYVEVICRAESIRLERSIMTGLSISGNKKQLQELVTNLLSNAVRYTSGCQKRRITISLCESDAMLVLSVSDTGIGISAERLLHVFDRFYRAQDSSDRIGHGLGLAIVRSIVERHGGTIHVESVENAGTTFTVSFPI